MVVSKLHVICERIYPLIYFRKLNRSRRLEGLFNHLNVVVILESLEQRTTDLHVGGSKDTL